MQLWIVEHFHLQKKVPVVVNHNIWKKSYVMIYYYIYLFVKMKMFNYSELHFSKVTSFKIHTLGGQAVMGGAQSAPSGWDRINWSAKTLVGNCPPCPSISYGPKLMCRLSTLSPFFGWLLQWKKGSVFCPPSLILHYSSARTTDAWWGNGFHCTVQNQIPIPNF